MARIMHYLKHNAKSESPKNILLVDTEARIERENGTEKQFQTFRLGVAIHKQRYKDSSGNEKWTHVKYFLRSVDDFWNLLDKILYDKTKLYVYAHNMGYDYTLLKLDSYLSERQMKITTRVIDTVFIIKAKNVVFLSSTNYYQKSLKALGKIFGMEKQECPDFENVSDEILIPYCENDTEVLAHLIINHIKFIKDMDLGSFKTTIAAQALGAFRHRFMKEAKILIHTFEEILEMEMASYRGGRCEAFIIGKKEMVYKLDVNSMYPYVMKDNLFPVKPKSSKPLENLSLEDIIKEIKAGNFLLIECEMEIYSPAIACKREKLLFPIGKISQTITNPEIDYLLKHPEIGKITKIKKAVAYESARIFNDYVSFFYDLKVNAPNSAITEMAKLFLNSLYGKFGQRSSTLPKEEKRENIIKMYFDIMKETNTFVVTNLDDETSKYIKLGETLYHIEKTKEKLARESSPIIASTVTAYSRIYLYDLMSIAGLENVFYCDTDSLFVSKTGYDNLLKADKINKKELGKLKLEEIGECEIKGAKNYSFNSFKGEIPVWTETFKLKGIKHNAKRNLDGSYSQLYFNTKNSRYRKATPDGIVILEPIVKTISTNYDKGNVDSLGIITPLRLSEW